MIPITYGKFEFTGSSIGEDSQEEAEVEEGMAAGAGVREAEEEGAEGWDTAAHWLTAGAHLF